MGSASSPWKCNRVSPNERNERVGAANAEELCPHEIAFQKAPRNLVVLPASAALWNLPRARPKNLQRCFSLLRLENRPEVYSRQGQVSLNVVAAAACRAVVGRRRVTRRPFS